MRDALLLAGGTFVLAVLLGQQTLYNRDAHLMLLHMGRGEWVHSHHFLFFTACQTVHLLGEALGWSLHTSARLASALGTAVGVFFVHRASHRLGMARVDAALVTALVAACPAVLFFATVVEAHGPYFAAVGLAALATARFTSSPSVGGAALLGAATGFAYCWHATANLMPAVLLPLAFAYLWHSPRPPSPVRILALFAVAALVHGTIVVAAPWVLASLGLIVRTGDALQIITEPLALLTARPDWPWQLPRLVAIELYKEWMRPMAPLSVLFVAGFLRRGLRLQTAALVVGLVPYLALVTVVLTPYPENSERGAYLVPLVWPAALLVVAALPRGAVLVTLVASLVLAVHDIAEHDRPERGRAWAQGLAEASDGHRPFVLVGDYPDLEAIHVHAPDVPFVFVHECLAAGPGLLPLIDRQIAVERAQGHRVFVTAGTLAWLEDPAVAAAQPMAPLLAQHLRTHYRLRAVDARGFHGYALE